MKTVYICECGLSFRKSNYFTNHKSICKFENTKKLNNALNPLEEIEIEGINQWWNKYSDRIFIQKIIPKNWRSFKASSSSKNT